MFERSVSQILLIEDNPLDIDLIRHALQKDEGSVSLSIARDGEEALEYLKQWDEGLTTPIVILLDLNLPKIGGFEVLKKIKTHLRYKILPVVVLTSSNNMGDIQKAYRLGANSYIIKSIDYDQLANAVNLIHRYWCELNIHPE
jgi:CheY-like chemotaxis protein